MSTFVTADPRAGYARRRRWSHSPARVFGALLILLTLCSLLAALPASARPAAKPAKKTTTGVTPFAAQAGPVTLAVTAPNGGETLVNGVATTVTWSIGAGVDTGVFGLYAVSDTDVWTFIGYSNVVAGQVDYTIAWTPATTTGNYRILLYYGLSANVWTANDYSDAYFTIKAGPKVTAPNGGETLMSGAPTKVTWTIGAPISSGVFGLYAVSDTNNYYAIGNHTYEPGVTDYSHDWTPTLAPGTYRIRVYYGPTAGVWTISDWSDATFTVTAPQVTYPNGGETIAGGAPTTVTWSLTTALETGVFGVYAVSEGGDWFTIGTKTVESGAKTYSMSWTPTVPSGNYRIRLSYGLSAGVWIVNDWSDAYFAVQSPQVTAPNGGETVVRGVPTTVTWSSGALNSGVFGLYAVSDGGSWYTIGTVDVTPGSTAYSTSWTPNVPVGNYRIRLYYGPTSGDWTMSDWSNSAFAVATEPRVTSPNGGETLASGLPSSVTWSVGAPVGSGTFCLWAVSSGGPTYLIGYAPAVPGETAYSLPWTPNVPGGSYRVQLSYGPTPGNWTTSDTSDADLTLAGGPQLTSPGNGKELYTGLPSVVKWSVGKTYDSGVFGIWAVAATEGKRQPGTYHYLGTVAVQPDTLDYGMSWTPDLPDGTYRLRIAYGPSEGAWTVYDWSDGTISVGPSPATSAHDLVVVGKYAYVADGPEGLKIFDVAVPDSPILVGTCDTPGDARDVSVVAGHAYVADGGSGLQVVDVTDPTAPVIVGSVATPAAAQHLTLSAGRLLEDFENILAWQVIDPGDVTEDVVNVKHGAKGIKVSLDAGGDQQLRRDSLGWDLSKEQGALQLWVYVDPSAGRSEATLTIRLCNANNFADFFESQSNTSLHDGWNLLRLSSGDWKATGDASWAEPIQRLNMVVANRTINPVTVTFDELRAGVRGLQSAFIWTFDDGYKEIYDDVFPYLDANGMRGTVYSWTAKMGIGGTWMSVAELRALYDSGWAIANHTQDHLHLTQLSQTEAAAQIAGGRDWLIGQGFTRAANHLAFPFNEFNQTVLAAAADAGVLSARDAGYRGEPLPLGEPLVLSSYSYDNAIMTFDEWKAVIDRAIAGGNTVIAGAHLMDETSLPTFEAVVDYLAAKNVWCPPIDEWWNTSVLQSQADAAYAGRYAYVACGAAGVQVIDVSDPAHPQLRGVANTPGSATDVAVQDDFIATADGGGGLQVVNAGDPASPTVVGASAGADTAQGVFVRDGIAYVAESEAGLRLVGLGTGGPVTIGSVETFGDAFDVAVLGDLAYVANGPEGVTIVDVSDPAAPEVVDSRSLPMSAEALVVVGPWVYVADGAGGLQVVPAATTP